MTMAAELRCIDHDPDDDHDPSEARWQRLFGRWLAIKAQWNDEPSMDDEQATALNKEVGEIVRAMAATPCPRRFLRDKLDVLEDVMFDCTASKWGDRRDWLLLASLKADVEDNR
jgi:hypothetical protein